MSLALLPLSLAYSAIVTVVLAKKHRQATTMLSRLRGLDPLWDEDHIHRRVELAYFSIQSAWTNRDQDIAREYVSDRLYAKHKMQTDEMIASHRRNVLENVNLMSADIIGVRDFNDDARDHFEVHIKGSMADYMVNDETGAVVSGKPGETELFTEIWRFVRGEDDWVLDEIEQDAGLLRLIETDCASQAVAVDAV